LWSGVAVAALDAAASNIERALICSTVVPAILAPTRYNLCEQTPRRYSPTLQLAEKSEETVSLVNEG
jgi:hypothetical protein